MKEKSRQLFVVAIALASALVFVTASIASAQEPEAPTVVEPRRAELEMQLTYAHSSNNRLQVHGYSLYDAIIIGKLRVHEIRRDVVISSLVLRLGLSDKTSLEILVPLSYRKDNVLKATHTTEDGKPTQFVADTCGIGDVEIALSYGAVVGSAKIPVVTTIGVKTVTGLSPYDAPDNEVALGSGHWGARVGVTATKVIDPVVFFGNLSYVWNGCREVEGYGVVDPGDTIGYSIGAAYAVTPRLSLNARLEQQFTSASRRDHVWDPSSESVAANFYIGASYTLDSGINLDVTVGLGLTEDSPDFSLSLARVLYRF